MMFIKCTEKERRAIVELPDINRFLTNRAAKSVNGVSQPIAVIPQEQIDKLRFMLGQSDIPVSLVDTPYKAQDKIVVVRGSLKGLGGEVVQTVEANL